MDSTLLMKITKEIQALEFVQEAVAVMGTDMNKTVIAEFGGLSEDVNNAGPNDLIISVQLDESNLSRTGEIEACVKNLLSASSNTSCKNNIQTSFPNISLAAEAMGGAGLAIISLPGEFAAAEAIKALNSGMNVFIFSDNVPISDEVEIKKIGRDKGLLVMGPGAGTAVIDNISIGLMSKVRQGSIGIAAASGSGLQEVAVILHRLGLGISQAIGTGGRDLSKEIGGSTMLHAVDILLNDPDTDVLILISKPPHIETAKKIYDKVRHAHKPVIIHFLGCQKNEVEQCGAYWADTLESTAYTAYQLVCNKKAEVEAIMCKIEHALSETARSELSKLKPCQRYLRGLFCGGTHSEEAVVLLRDKVDTLYSNILFGGAHKLADRNSSVKNTLIDMGDEEFTRGRLHPVMDPTILCDRLIQEASDREVAVILLDIILGYAVHPDPVGAIMPALSTIHNLCKNDNRHICIIASVCGTDMDPQSIELQTKKLREAGVIVVDSNAQAAILAGMVIREASAT